MITSRNTAMVLALTCAVACGGSSTQAPDGAPGDGNGGSDGDASSTCPGEASGPQEVRVEQGVVRGELQDIGGTAVRRFLAVPYAAPPVGPLRFAPPRAPSCFGAAREANAFGAVCPQHDRNSGVVLGKEDCLLLNVWAPVGASDAPVLVFVHGGGNAFGAASELLADGTHRRYDGARLAAHEGAIVVTLNYRLGILGFLAHPELDAESASGQLGSLGILDQIAALQWVQRNIEAFGGDPSKVLLFGESAGARDVCVLVASPLAVGLFSAALMQSGSCLVPAREAVLEATRQQIAASGCSGATEGEIACLRGVDFDQLLDDYPSEGPPLLNPFDVAESLQPHVDGHVLTAPPEEALASGIGSDVPFVVGVNSRESSILVGNAIVDESEYVSALRAAFGGQADAVLAQYPADAYASPRDAFVALASDARFVGPARRAARAAATGSRSASTYRYLFDQGLSQQDVLKFFGAYHGVELAYVFDSVGEGAYAASADERALARTVGAYWTRLAAAGDPNGAGLVEWPAFTSSSAGYLRFSAAAVEPGVGFRDALCDFWDGL